MMSLWDALRMNMMISYQELVRTFLSFLLAIIILRVQHSNKLLLRTCRFIHPLPVLPFPEHSVHSGDKM
ncbi:hypothetical protein C5Y39_016420 [Klebsiella pneumoniae subsp. pneumoniae]|nr:hypothetical protein C5Y39_016420 [Klebsiella pneumoniae subsp. pneumoniae]